MTIGERIKLVRKQNGMTQKQFADVICISNVSVSQLESGRFNMANTTKELLCTKFHVNPVWLETGEGAMYTKNETADMLVSELVEILNDNKAVLNALSKATQTFSAEDWSKLNAFIESLGVKE